MVNLFSALMQLIFKGPFITNSNKHCFSIYKVNNHKLTHKQYLHNQTTYYSQEHWLFSKLFKNIKIIKLSTIFMVENSLKLQN